MSTHMFSLRNMKKKKKKKKKKSLDTFLSGAMFEIQLKFMARL